RSDGLGHERAHLARGVGALEGRQVDELDDAIEGPRLRARLDRSCGEPRRALLEADRVDARESLEVLPEAALGEVAAEEPHGTLGGSESCGLHGHESSRRARAVASSVMSTEH